MLSPDLLFVTTLFEGYHDNSVTSVKKFALDCKTAVILYDLIPLINEQEYLKTETQKEYYYKKLEYLKKADLFLAISEHSKKEALEVLNIDASKVFNISTAVEDDFLPVSMPQKDIVNFLNHYKIKQNFLLYVPGGFDYRKNCERLLEAYSKLPDVVRSNHQLVIASKIADDKKEYLLAKAQEVGLKKVR